MHALVGGGDQVYSDKVWACPALQEWSKLEGREEKIDAEWTEEMQTQATTFYCKNYLNTFSAGDIWEAMATIPQLMMWDDHDIWDGYGSYDEDMQNCHIFKVSAWP
ncbi:hypothetical protein H632_c331p2 [Helicosporidium sp. ATCC 50920]|nr:hypothetical protein H632_c331p2 [Helicosporidium sp. ATCC 50920]|eukprot:KDD76165.1 hypothetical protein H632_c331p2 [Helicosporidium sp. ATCC 50920]